MNWVIAALSSILAFTAFAGGMGGSGNPPALEVLNLLAASPSNLMLLQDQDMVFLGIKGDAANTIVVRKADFENGAENEAMVLPSAEFELLQTASTIDAVQLGKTGGNVGQIRTFKVVQGEVRSELILQDLGDAN